MNLPYYGEIVQIIQFSRKIIEDIFIKEIEKESEFGKTEEVIILYKNEKKDQSYNINIELDKMIKLFFSYNNKISILNDDLSLKKFNRFIKLILEYRNQIAHNRLKIDSLKINLKTILDCLIDENMKDFVKESQIKYVMKIIKMLE